MAESPLRLTLLSRSYCHLCHEMLAAIETLKAEFEFVVDVVEVDNDATLEARYGDEVPVLLHWERELARHRLDPGNLRLYLAQGAVEI